MGNGSWVSIFFGSRKNRSTPIQLPSEVQADADVKGVAHDFDDNHQINPANQYVSFSKDTASVLGKGEKFRPTGNKRSIEMSSQGAAFYKGVDAIEKMEE